MKATFFLHVLWKEYRLGRGFMSHYFVMMAILCLLLDVFDLRRFFCFTFKFA